MTGQRQMRRRGKGAPGMTLVEIMIVVIVMALIASGVAYAVVPTITSTRSTQTQTDVRMIHNAVSLFMVRQGACPDSVDDLSLSNTTRRVDPWGNGFIISCDIEGEPVVLSFGPDGQQGTEDDISSAEEELYDE